ncbi:MULTISPECIES: helix-turn-helix domain-containing protein [Flavobacterium]|uniref:Helix-turn-helix transcriptional regulator n=2 Tax=Flavobacterium covae TaxID=2906076 RepID=A0ABW8PIK4_9FLAO|nr:MULTISPECIES: helix-turn-helix transcriptional regulator [Flavobacterium]MCJ1806944.1 helix-turn-helix domain-containing protein [Flavobacterium covae]MCJ1809751.1 helix-turn-helix domain-containing protein [Flavobacterium covae]
MMNEFEDLGVRFNRYLISKGLGVNQIARILELSGSQISNIKNGKVFGADKMFKILNTFTDLDANWLFRGESMEHPEIDINRLDYIIELQKERIIDLKKENAELKKMLKAKSTE